MTSIQSSTSQPSTTLPPAVPQPVATAVAKKPNPLQKIKAAIDKATEKKPKSPEERLEKPISRPMPQRQPESLHEIMQAARAGADELDKKKKLQAKAPRAAKTEKREDSPGARAWAWLRAKTANKSAAPAGQDKAAQTNPPVAPTSQAATAVHPAPVG